MPGIEDFQELIAELRAKRAQEIALIEQVNAKLTRLLDNLPVLSRGLSDEDYRRRDAQQQTALKGQLQECPVLGECAVPGGEPKLVSVQYRVSGGPWQDLPLKDEGEN